MAVMISPQREGRRNSGQVAMAFREDDFKARLFLDVKVCERLHVTNNFAPICWLAHISALDEYLKTKLVLNIQGV
jgi:hypothetical protein